uniref:Uncharacterized protein n=1 Tax=Clandestinovirus TaxID=2831644 RepID=A0A8F8KR16_9VIRU|nr:hypothetical protein KOM_12_168 [Clandestinovirus]
MTSVALPQEIIVIIEEKKRIEEDDMKMEVFEEFIIPWIYHFRQYSDFIEDPQLNELGNLFGSVGEHLSAYMLTSVRRVCKRLNNKVSLGYQKMISFYSTGMYFANKRNPFK